MATSTLFDVGDTVRSSAAFTNADGTATDPTTITFKWQTPAGVMDSYAHGTDAEVVKDSAGNFHVDLTLDAAGVWRWYWVGTGAVAQAEQGSWHVRETPLA